jgi:peptidyl-prolyl cis-trans isomerase D
MFDLFRSRDKAVRILLGFILVVVAASMVTYLIPNSNLGGTTAGNETVLAELGGQKLTQQEFQKHFAILLQGMQVDRPDQVRLMYPQYMQGEIQKMALLYIAKQLGITVSDEDVLIGVQSQWPQFFQNGGVNRDQFEQYLANLGLTVQEATDVVRDQMIMARLQDSLLRPVVTKQEVDTEFARRHDKAKISYIAFPAGKFIDQVKPTEDDIKKTYDFNRANFPIPAKSSYQVLVVDQEKVAATMTVTDAQLHQAYSQSMDNFRMPERIHVRHILVSTEGKSDAEKKTLKAKADDILKQLKNGADFAELAKKDSDDKGSGEKGGDLDWIVKGQMQVPEFEAAAFALKPKEMSGVVTSSLGYHIIQVTEKEPARVKPFDEVKAGLAEELKKEGVSDKVQSIADQARAALAMSPGSAEEVAKKFGVELVTVPEGIAGQPTPVLGLSPEIDSTVASMRPNEVSAVVPLSADRLAVVVLKARTPARIATLDEVREQVRLTFVQQKAQEIADQTAKDAVARLRQGEDMEKVAKSYKLAVVTSSLFGSADSVEGLGLATYVADAFSKPVGTILGPTPINGQDVVSKVLEQVRADPSILASQRDQIVQQIKKNKGTTEWESMEDSVVTQLLKEGKLKRNDEAINALASSYAPK